MIEIGRFLGTTVKRFAVVLVLGLAREPYDMSMAWEPDRRSNFFFGPPAHLYMCRHITEISLNVKYSKQPISFTHAPIMENKHFLSIHKIRIVCQYVHFWHFSYRHPWKTIVSYCCWCYVQWIHRSFANVLYIKHY